MSKETDIHRGKGYGFVADGKLYLIRCFECGKENYGPNVPTGTCTWCGDKPGIESSEVGDDKRTL